MDQKTDRRSGLERRSSSEPAEVDARQRQRRMGDRRDSPRLPIKLLVRDVEAGGSFEERDGDIGVGGVFFKERFVPTGRRVELRFQLPTMTDEIRCEGEVVHFSEADGRTGAHVQFLELPIATERAIARFIDERVAQG
jgi:hypothetical protein